MPQHRINILKGELHLLSPEQLRNLRSCLLTLESAYRKRYAHLCGVKKVVEDIQQDYAAIDKEILRQTS